MHLTHLIVDDFLPDPDAVRREVLKMPFPPRHADSVYPGRNAEHRLQFDGLEGLIGGLVHEKLTPKLQTAHAKPRMALEGDTSKISVHVDNCHWSAMVYLSLDEHCQGGTHFFELNIAWTNGKKSLKRCDAATIPFLWQSATAQTPLNTIASLISLWVGCCSGAVTLRRLTPI